MYTSSETVDDVNYDVQLFSSLFTINNVTLRIIESTNESRKLILHQSTKLYRSNHGDIKGSPCSDYL